MCEIPARFGHRNTFPFLRRRCGQAVSPDTLCAASTAGPVSAAPGPGGVSLQTGTGLRPWSATPRRRLRAGASRCSGPSAGASQDAPLVPPVTVSSLQRDGCLGDRGCAHRPRLGAAGARACPRSASAFHVAQGQLCLPRCVRLCLTRWQQEARKHNYQHFSWSSEHRRLGVGTERSPTSAPGARLQRLQVRGSGTAGPPVTGAAPPTAVLSGLRRAVNSALQQCSDFVFASFVRSLLLLVGLWLVWSVTAGPVSSTLSPTHSRFHN